MAKLIKITEEIIAEMRVELEEAIKKAKVSNGKFTFTKDLGTVDRKAQIYYTEVAWLKQEALVREFDKEVAWHGIAKRDPEEPDAFIIEDILVYPQHVTGTTVTTDQEEYQNWLYKWDDEIFNNIRMQGHSHVNMGTTPSSVDENLYDNLLSQLTGDMFYIFLIFNKRGNRTAKIYDMRENVFYEDKDITISIIQDGPGIETFIDQAKELVKTTTATTTVATTAPATTKPAQQVASNIPVSTGGGKKKAKKAKSSSGGNNSSSDWNSYYDDDYYYGSYGRTGYNGYSGYSGYGSWPRTT